MRFPCFSADPSLKLIVDETQNGVHGEIPIDDKDVLVCEDACFSHIAAKRTI